MIYDKKYSSYSIKEPIVESEILELVSDNNCKWLVINERLEKQSWVNLNGILFATRKDIFLEVVENDYNKVLDLSFASFLTNLEYFSARAYHSSCTESITCIKNLKKLYLHINLSSTSCFEDLNPDLEELKLGPTKANIDLSILRRFKNLKKLRLEYHKKNIDAISELENLEELTLYAIPITDVNFLSNLKKLLSLEVILGKISDFSGIKGIGSLRYLGLYQLRNLTDIGFISELSGLQYVFLGNLPKVDRLPDFGKLNKLRRIYLDNLKSLRDFSILQTAPNLEEFGLINTSNNEPEELEVLLKLPKLKTATVEFTSVKKNERFGNMIEGTNLETGIDRLHFDFV